MLKCQELEDVFVWCVVFGYNAEMCEKFGWCDWDGVGRWIGHGRVKE